MATLVLDEFQEQVAAHEDGRALVTAAAGCHRAGQLILLYDGRVVPVESIKVGDQLMGPDSRPRTVQRLIRGKGEMVWVKPVKGAPFVVNVDHVLTVKMSGWKYAARGEGDLIDVTVRDALLKRSEWKKNAKLIRAGCSFPPGPRLPIDPYFLGALLGDGSMLSGVALSKPGKEIERLVKVQGRVWGLRVYNSEKRSNGCPDWHFTVGRKNNGPGKNPLINALRELGLYGLLGEQRFVPEVYKTSSRKNRLAIVAGLVDTDGHISLGGCDYISKSKRLVEDFAFLCRSLGFAAYFKSCQKSDQNGTVGTYWRCHVSGDLTSLPTRIKRAVPRRQIKDVLRTGFALRRTGTVESFYGFTLDGDGRYLLGDFTITHNSGKTEVLVQNIARRIEAGTDAPRIVALTFNKSANETIVERLGARTTKVTASRAEIRTFHGFAMRLLNKWFGGDAAWDVIKLADYGKLVACATSPMKLYKLDGEVKDWISTSNFLREVLVDFTDPAAASRIQSILDVGPNRALEVLRFCTLFQQEKVKRNVFDFTDYLWIAALTITSGGPHVDALGEAYDYAFFDEAQDWSPARYVLARAVSDRARASLAVCDPSQAINAFAAADMRCLLDWRSRSSASYTLPVNRRSTAEIVEAAQALVAEASWPVAPQRAVDGCEGPMPEIYDTPDPIAEARLLAEEIVEEIATSDTTSVAVLSRTNAWLAEIEWSLRRRNVPIRVRGQSGGAWATREGLQILGYLAATEDKAHDGLLSAANAPKRYCKRDDVRAALEVRRRNKASIVEALRGTNGKGALRLADDIERISMLAWTDRCFAVRKMLMRSVAEADDAGVKAEDPDSDRSVSIALLLGQAEESGSFEALIKLIDSIKDSKDARVELSSIHRMKGDQADVVYVVGVNAQHLPHKASTDLDEERRILYVAMTRAKRQLVISTGGKRSMFLESIASQCRQNGVESTPRGAVVVRRKASTLALAPGVPVASPD